MIKILLTLVLFLSLQISASEGPEFWRPRSREALVIAGIDSPFTSYRQLERQREGCIQEAEALELCSLLKKIKIPMVGRPVALSTFLDEDSKFLVLGEKHTSSLPKRIILDWLPALERAYKFTHVALEGFNASSQKDLDAFLNDEISEVDLTRILESQWFFDSKGYIEIAAMAKTLGLGLLAVDIRDKKSPDLSFSDALIVRDKFWVEILNRSFESNPKTKILLLAGTTHAFRSFSGSRDVQTIVEQLKELGIKGQSLFIHGRKEGSLHQILKDKYNPDRNWIYSGEEILPYTSGLLMAED